MVLLELTTRYATAGLDLSPGAAGPVFLTMVFYEMLYTGIGSSLLRLSMLRLLTAQLSSSPHTPLIPHSRRFLYPLSSRCSSPFPAFW